MERTKHRFTITEDKLAHKIERSEEKAHPEYSKEKDLSIGYATVNRRKAKCPKDKTTLRSYDGGLGYEAIFCPKCGYYEDYYGKGHAKEYIGVKGPESVFEK